MRRGDQAADLACLHRQCPADFPELGDRQSSEEVDLAQEAGLEIGLGQRRPAGRLDCRHPSFEKTS
jgi:hypothetical protein